MERLQQQVKLPRLYQESILKAEERKLRAEQIQQMKVQRLIQAEQEKRAMVQQKREEERRKVKQAIEDAKLKEQARRNAFRAQQEVSELMAYERQYGKVYTCYRFFPPDFGQYIFAFLLYLSLVLRLLTGIGSLIEYTTGMSI